MYPWLLHPLILSTLSYDALYHMMSPFVIITQADEMALSLTEGRCWLYCEEPVFPERTIGETTYIFPIPCRVVARLMPDGQPRCIDHAPQWAARQAGNDVDISGRI